MPLCKVSYDLVSISFALTSSLSPLLWPRRLLAVPHIGQEAHSLGPLYRMLLFQGKHFPRDLPGQLPHLLQFLLKCHLPKRHTLITVFTVASHLLTPHTQDSPSLCSALFKNSTYHLTSFNRLYNLLIICVYYLSSPTRM